MIKDYPETIHLSSVAFLGGRAELVLALVEQ